MRLLLDTHIFLWLILANPQLLPAFRSAIQDKENEVYLSVASTWEVIIKYQTGKLSLPQPPETYLPMKRIEANILILPIDEQSVVKLAKLPLLHRDPFDRILMAQAMQHNLVLVTDDTFIRAYPHVPLL